MNLSHKRIAEIRSLVSAGIQLGPNEAEDLLGHNDHLTELCEARARLVLRAESESETLRGLYQMHKQTETREMRDLKAELAGLKTGYEAYERVNAELRAECEALRVKLENPDPILIQCLDAAIAEQDHLEKDAARYRWTSTEGNWVAHMFGKWRAHIGAYGDASPTEWYETREEAIDAAMSKEASHD